MRALTSTTSLALLVAVSVLWLLAKGLSLAPPITVAKVVDALLFVLLLVWFVVRVVGLVG
jgi:hypothetical protein